jgi:arylsulfatase A-like enzyme
VLVADTLRADHLSSYGYSRPTTPRLDRLASEGWAFLDAYSSSSWTLPAHASLMTGRRMHEHHAGEQRRPYLDRQFATLAEVLGGAGYVSAGFVANTFWCGRNTGLDRGFVHYEDFYGSVGDALARTVLGRLLAYEVLPRFGLLDFPGRKRAADVNERMLDWIDGVGDRPFFVFANYMDVHGPYLPPPGYEGRFGGKRPLRRAAEIELGAVHGGTIVPEPEVLRAWMNRYDESLVYLDEQIGRLVDELARRGVLDKTIVVFTSDHGENWGEHN